MNALICQAIREKKLLEFSYEGGLRVVEPHCHGTTTAGNPGLRAFQIRGHSSSGGIPDWRLFDLSKAAGIKLLSETFTGSRPGYKKGDKGMSSIFCEL